jgi:putative DNA primase/helicase
LAPKIDVRGAGGYVIGAGSLHANGKIYRYRRGKAPYETAIAPLPAWVIHALTKNHSQSESRLQAAAEPDGHGLALAITPEYAAAALEREIEAVERAIEGTRNDVLNRASFSLGQLVAAGALEQAEVEAKLAAAALACGLLEAEYSKTIASGIASGLKRPRNGPSAADRQLDPITAECSRFGETDTDNALRLQARFGHGLRYVGEHGKFYWYDGKRWRADLGRQSRRCMQETARFIDKEARFLLGTEAQDARIAWAKTSLGGSAIDRALEQVKPYLDTRADQFDANGWLLNVENGTLDLRTSELHPHAAADLITRITPVSFDPNAECPRFRRFLRKVMRGSKSLVRFLRQFIGYTLTGDIREQVFVYLKGGGSNGKSTLVVILQALLGDYAVAMPTETLLAKRNPTIPNDIARLKGARMACAVEANAGRQLDEALVKSVTGGDPVTGRFLYGEYFSFVPEFKLYFVANDDPRVRSTDEAIWRRILVVPFDYKVPEAEKDKMLTAKLKEELPVILAWAVNGCQEWRAGGLVVPEKVRSATKRYRTAVDHVGRFLGELVTFEVSASVPTSDLHKAYANWCAFENEKPLDDKKLAQHLEEAGLTKARTAKTRVWKGARLTRR